MSSSVSWLRWFDSFRSARQFRRLTLFFLSFGCIGSVTEVTWATPSIVPAVWGLSFSIVAMIASYFDYKKKLGNGVVAEEIQSIHQL